MGDRVFLRSTPKPGLSRKLQALWQGPFRVVERKSPVVFKIKSLASGRTRTAHLENIRRVEEIHSGGEDPFPTDVPVESKDLGTTGLDRQALQGGVDQEKIDRGHDGKMEVNNENSDRDQPVINVGRAEPNTRISDAAPTGTDKRNSVKSNQPRREMVNLNSSSTHSYNLRHRGPRV